jgi:hypothetical protein
MKTTVLAAVAAFALALSVAPTFAAGNMGNNQQAQRSESSNTYTQCANILANPEAYPKSDVAACRQNF